jgi:hypothetical protein
VDGWARDQTTHLAGAGADEAGSRSEERGRKVNRTRAGNSAARNWKQEEGSVSREGLCVYFCNGETEVITEATGVWLFANLIFIMTGQVPGPAYDPREVYFIGPPGLAPPILF